MTAVEYRNVCMAYGDENVIENFNLSVAAGEFLAIIGTSGSGKTTILKMVNGLVMPTGGEVLVRGQSTRKADLIQLRRSTGYVIQGNVLFPHLTVEKNIAFVPELSGAKRGDTRARVGKLLELVGLDDELRSRYPAQLSGGQQQRVGFARALAAAPDILLMDEPFGAVDKITREALQEEIRRIHHDMGITILFVTHDINEALKLGDRVLVMDKGKIMQCARPEIIVNHPANEFVEDMVSNEATQ